MERNPDDSTYQVRVTKDGGVQEGFAEKDALLNITEHDLKEVLEYPGNNTWRQEELHHRWLPGSIVNADFDT